MIEILTAGALATVQDLGRVDCMRWGVGSSGAMDPLALAAGNLLVGNEGGEAAIEIPVFPFSVRFLQDCTFAVTGADCAATLDDVPLMPWWAQAARVGQVLTLRPPQSGVAWRASRAYFCLGGGIDVPEVLGSRSTQLRGAFGGHQGRSLRSGDTLRAGDTLRSGASGFTPGRGGIGLVAPGLSLPLQVDGYPAVRVLPAGEYDRFTPAAREAFWTTPWKITAQSDRYGYRLAGTPLEATTAADVRSHGIVPGVVQVPPAGQPIVQMRDAQPSGGYPKIGTVIEADLWRLGQAPIGTHVRFIETSWAAALEALDEISEWLDQCRHLLALHRRAEALQ